MTRDAETDRGSVGTRPDMVSIKAGGPGGGKCKKGVTYYLSGPLIISDVVRKYGRLFDNRRYVLIDDVIKNGPTCALQLCTSLICPT